MTQFACMHATPYPPIGDYALLSDCHSTALVSRHGSVDWCCMPRLDADSCFGRLLDWQQGGHCTLAPAVCCDPPLRAYAQGTLVLLTEWRLPTGRLRVHDFLVMPKDPEHFNRPELIRLAEVIEGEVELRVEVQPRFDYGEVVPSWRRYADGVHTACGSNKGLVIRCDRALEVNPQGCALAAQLRLGTGERLRLAIRFVAPEWLDEASPVLAQEQPESLDRALHHTLNWWRDWFSRMPPLYADDALSSRSTLVLKGLTCEQTGAIAAAATTSLPESPGGTRNWDYRYSWVRDSVFVVAALHALGFEREADRFRAFIERSAAGSAEQLQLMYAVDGKRRLTELSLPWLEGWRGARPVRMGNEAARQTQLDVYGMLMALASLWHDGRRPLEPAYWDFLCELADVVCERWRHADHGIWEFRGAPRHFVHSKVMCWVALQHAILIADRYAVAAPPAHWLLERDAIRAAIEQHGYDARRGVFVQSFDRPELDAALLLLPRFGFIAPDDPRMVRTTDAVVQELGRDGLLLRYQTDDGIREPEGVFLPCTFWLSTVLASQGRLKEAWGSYRRAAACANDLGLFSEEYDPRSGEMLGNFPQALTHVSQLEARIALARAEG